MNANHLQFKDDNGDPDTAIFRIQRDGRLTVYAGTNAASGSLFLSKADATTLRDWLTQHFPHSGGKTVDKSNER